jgi:hypothetical protein
MYRNEWFIMQGFSYGKKRRERVMTLVVGLDRNEKDSPTVDLTVRPLSGAITAIPLLNSDGGAKVKTSGNLGDFALFNCLSAH